MRVLQVHNRYRELGGEDAVAGAEASMLEAAGHEVLQHYVSNPGGAAASVTAMAGAPWNPASARAVARTAAAWCPDIAHIHNTWFKLSPSVVTALHRAGIPVVVTLHNYRLVCVNALLFRNGQPCQDCVATHPWAGVRHRCYRDSVSSSAVVATTLAVNRVRRTWLDHVDRFIAPTQMLRDVMVAGGLPPDRMVVRPHAVADPGLRQSPPSRSATVLFVGRVSAEKGIDVLLDAWGLACPRSIKLVVVGDGPRRAELERREVEGVTFSGWLPPEEVRRHLLTSRALVFPSLCYEVLPSAILEAMAAGLPVLASSHGGSAELASNLGRSWMARPGDRADLADGIARLQDDVSVDVTGAVARRLYQQRYDPGLGLHTLLAVYEAARDHYRGPLECGGGAMTFSRRQR
jgi:glycosyltransferase involved in cell wall biosynthesis